MLAQLPTLGKDEYREGLMWDPECLENAAMVSHTTGTTGRVTWRHRTRAEAAVIAKLFGSRPDLREDPRFGISIRYNRHGMEMPVPGVGTMVPVSLSEDVDVRQVLELLQVGCVLHGVRRHPSVLAGGGMDVAIIARAIVEAGFADAAARIDRVLVGGHLPKAIRATVERALPQATISGHYSLAEVFGGASSLPDGSGYLTEAHVIAEVLDDDDAPTPEGSFGELTLTEVFPFVQAQPVIRYRTGDIVECLPCEEPWRVRFRWWGRRAHSLRDRDAWVLGEGPLADALLAEPLVARQLHRGQLSASSATIGYPLVDRIEGSDGEVAGFAIGVRRDPWHLGPHLDRLLGGIRRAASSRASWSRVARPLPNGRPASGTSGRCGARRQSRAALRGPLR